MAGTLALLSDMPCCVGLDRFTHFFRNPVNSYMRFLFWGDATKGDVYPLVIVDTDPSRSSGMKSNTYNPGWQAATPDCRQSHHGR
jgi:hypothetical protein